MDPDYRKDKDREEYYRHFIDLERYGAFPFSDLDLDYERMVRRFGRKKVVENGIVLWAAEKTFNQLLEAFRRQNLKQILLYSSDLSHYVADLHQPLHTTENYNGQLTGQLGIHFRFEIDLLDQYIDEIHFSQASPIDLGPVLPALHDTALESYVWVDNILLADRRIVSGLRIDRKQYLEKGKNRKAYPEQYFTRLFEEAGTVTEDRLNRAAHRLASLWWMAWEKAGSLDF